MKIIGIGEYAVSKREEDSIKTYALATCIGLVLYHKRDHILGMVHIVFPHKHTDRLDDIPYKEGYFADVAVPLIFKKVFGGYPTKETPYQVSLYGGVNSKNKNDIFCVGLRNIEIIEQILRENGIHYDKKHTGGYNSRTIEVFVKDGSVKIYEQEMI